MAEQRATLLSDTCKQALIQLNVQKFFQQKQQWKL